MGTSQEDRRSPSGRAALTRALDAEQRYVDTLYARLDEERELAEKRLAETNLHGADGGTPQAYEEREAASVEGARRLGQLNSVDSGLCFGRIDLAHDTAHGDGTHAQGTHAEGVAPAAPTRATHYIGRIGLRGPDLESLLVDWRAPAARPFYAASPGAPGGVLRRRHLHATGREITGLDDEVFDLERLPEHDRRSLVGEAALLASLRSGRTGRMSDVVSTIQGEQDRVIRSGLPGVLVVQGGPGTGKTVAALHRAAYLLYTHRGTLARRGVLVVGPNAVFLRYISEVLPSLGETDVVLSTLGGLFPGVRAEAEDGPRAAVVKGDPRMAEVVARAVRAQQRDPGPGGLRVTVEGARPGSTETLLVPREVCVRARERAQALGAPHNVARKRYVTDLLAALVRVRAGRDGRPLDEEELRHGPGELWSRRPVRRALEELWPLLTPERLIGALLTDEALLRTAGEGLLEAVERAVLTRDEARAWTVGDVPLLDEAAELLGEDDSAARVRAREAAAERRAEEEYARGVLQLTGLDGPDGEGPVDVATLVDRHRDPGPVRTTADRAAGDRRWVYGHVIVDEAQELSAMAWRMVMRRVPGRSMTVVGDVAQTGSAAGARSWGQMLDPYVGGRWREESLTVNYRTPAEVMEPAARLLGEVAPGLEPPVSVRTGGAAPRTVRAARGALVQEAVRAVGEELAGLREEGGGKLALIAPGGLADTLATALPGGVRAVRGGGVAALDAPVAVLTVTEAKGLEFDRVVIADPVGIAARSPRGGHDLYVAVTRVTHRLTLVHEGEPTGVARLLM
ncbi:AAA family ATPase [Streptomyces sp. NBC_01795]|uniref:HelD family protein n=1 Tax=Streptomyces sp. NBC_01795 TaxID=2975943 RepID=UPI002DD7E458|nr:ATP-binding domain-containing protein [Streptomyces sp. NBC_01795]WSA96518.1 AAA family ATPase [Streptomyces sp. NBC_01795]